MSGRFHPARLSALVLSLAAVVILVGCAQPKTEKTKAEKSKTEAAKTPELKTPQPKVPAEKTPQPKVPAEKTPQPKPLAKAELLLELPDECNTPDGMCLLPDGNIILACPNLNDPSKPAVLAKITPDNKLEHFYDCPLHPDTGKAYPFGLCVDAEGNNLYMADLQWFADPKNPNYKSRVLRIPLEDGKPGQAVTLVEGMVVANAVIIKDGYIYVSDTSMVPGSDPLISGVFRVKLDEEGLQLKKPLIDDPHLIGTIKTHNLKVGFGADGLTFDSKGNLYIGNYADGTLHKIAFDEEGNPGEPEIFARVEFMRCCDGIFCDKKTDKIYVADSLANAVQVVSPDGSVQTLAVDPDNDGSDGRLDQPCEVLLRGNELIVSNMDFPVATGVNTKVDKPYTMSVIRLD